MAKKKNRVIDRDKGFKKLKEQFKKLQGKPRVAVGVMGAEAGERHENSDATVVEVASYNEFGTDTIPARSFLRATFDRDTSKFYSIIQRLRMQIASGEMKPEKALAILGQYAQAQVQKTITDGGVPFIPNSDATITKKGSSSPLIDTGQLRQSIRYEVRNGD